VQLTAHSVKLTLARWVLILIAASASALAVDHAVFSYLMLDQSRLVNCAAEDDDLAWWQGHVGDLPPREDVGRIQPPPTLPTMRYPRWQIWWRGAGPAAAEGAASATYRHRDAGLLPYRIDVDSTLVQGRVLSSRDVYAYRVGVAFPCVAVERWWTASHGVNPPHPVQGGWRYEIKPLGLLLNSLAIGAVFALLLPGAKRAIRSIRRSRFTKDQCAHCGHMLIAGQSRCPECGSSKAPSTTIQGIA
jgi:hypothetical protein